MLLVTMYSNRLFCNSPVLGLKFGSEQTNTAHSVVTLQPPHRLFNQLTDLHNTCQTRNIGLTLATLPNSLNVDTKMLQIY